MEKLLEEVNAAKNSTQASDFDLSQFITMKDKSANNDSKSTSVHHVYNAKAILYELGYMTKVTIQEGDTTSHIIIPQCSLYSNCGQELRHLNRLEYISLITF